MRPLSRPVLIVLVLALLGGLAVAAWLGVSRPTAPVAAPQAEQGASASTAEPLPEAIEGEEAGLSDADLAADGAAPMVIETDEGPITTDGAEVDESALSEADGGDLTTEAPAVSLPMAEAIALPSGRQVWWLDSVHDTQGPAGLTLRMRFIAPGLQPVVEADQQRITHEDMVALCEGFAVPRLGRPATLPKQVVITLMARQLEFGEADHQVTQFFEAFSLEAPAGGDPSDPATPLTCRWEVY